jgi:hypothetical protein
MQGSVRLRLRIQLILRTVNNLVHLFAHSFVTHTFVLFGFAFFILLYTFLFFFIFFHFEQQFIALVAAGMFFANFSRISLNIVE